MDEKKYRPSNDNKSLWSTFSGESPVFWLVFSFTIGVVLSPFSFGFVFLIAFLLLFSLASIAYNGNTYRSTNQAYLFLLGFFAVSVLGFLIGRTAVKKDWSPFRMDYRSEDDDVKNKWKEDDKKDEYDHEHEFCD